MKSSKEMSFSKAMYFQHIARRMEELEDMIADHDCHLSPMDSCECQEWRMELMGLSYPYPTL